MVADLRRDAKEREKESFEVDGGGGEEDAMAGAGVVGVASRRPLLKLPLWRALEAPTPAWKVLQE
jgi:hypothetical protein